MDEHIRPSGVVSGLLVLADALVHASIESAALAQHLIDQALGLPGGVLLFLENDVEVRAISETGISQMIDETVEDVKRQRHLVNWRALKSLAQPWKRFAERIFLVGGVRVDVRRKIERSRLRILKILIPEKVEEVVEHRQSTQRPGSHDKPKIRTSPSRAN